MLKKRLLWQLFPSYFLITLAALLAVSWYISHSLQRFYHNQVADDLEVRARLVTYQILPALKTNDFEEIDRLCNILGRAGPTRITVITPDGKVAGDSQKQPSDMENHANRPEFIEALHEGKGRTLRFSTTLGKNMMYLALPVKEKNVLLAVVRASIALTSVAEQLKDVRGKIIWAGLCAVMCAAVVSLIISRRISLPIEHMKDVAKHFASGDLALRVSTPKATELAELSEALNEMAGQLYDRINTITKQRNESEAILSSMIEGVLAVDETGHVVSINNAAAKLLGLTSEDVRGRNVEEIVRNTELQRFIRETIDSRQSIETDIYLPHDGGRFLRVYGTGLAGEHNTGRGAVIVFNDITRIHRLESVRRDFVANVSHELKTPITSIKASVETLLEGAIKEPEQANRFLQIIAKHADRLNAIIEDLLILSRLQEEDGKRKISFEITTLKSIIASAMELSKLKAGEKEVAINLDCNNGISLRANAVLLEQALFNLIDNAIKYSEPGGNVNIRVRSEGQEVVISVLDEGCGIEKRHLDRIFERFYVVDKSRSRNLGGTGLGLAIVKHIVKLHNGYIKVDSTIGKGSEFSIHIPIA